MNNEDFYEMLLAFVVSVRNDSNQDCFDWHLDQLDYDQDSKEWFAEQVSSK